MAPLFRFLPFLTSCTFALPCVQYSLRTFSTCVHSALRSLLLARALPCVQYFLRTFSTALRPCFLRAFSTAIITFSKCFALCSVLPACIQHCVHYFQHVSVLPTCIQHCTAFIIPACIQYCVHYSLRAFSTASVASYTCFALHSLLPACIQHCAHSPPSLPACTLLYAVGCLLRGPCVPRIWSRGFTLGLRGTGEQSAIGMQGLVEINVQRTSMWHRGNCNWNARPG